MKNLRFPGTLIISFFVIAGLFASVRMQEAGIQIDKQTLKDPREKHFANIRQLTFEGENAEAYFSPDGKKLIFQRTTKYDGCDQIFSMNIDGSEMKMISNGQGKTTCAYFTPDNKYIVYATTFLDDPKCPPKPDYTRGYVWALFPGFDIVRANLDGSKIKRLTGTPRYDAEATIRPDGTIVFTSLRNGDLDIYRMDKNGRRVKQLTSEIGYDGGPFWSRDGKLIVYRAFHPQTDKEKEDYLSLLKENLIRPSKLDLWVMNDDGSNKRRITNNGKANFAPYFYPGNRRIIFSSNMDDPRGRNFDLYGVNLDGSDLERITFNDTFDGFPMFSPDGKKIVFGSNRNAAKEGDTNVFIADWVE